MDRQVAWGRGREQLFIHGHLHNEIADSSYCFPTIMIRVWLTEPRRRLLPVLRIGRWGRKPHTLLCLRQDKLFTRCTGVTGYRHSYFGKCVENEAVIYFLVTLVFVVVCPLQWLPEVSCLLTSFHQSSKSDNHFY